MNKDMPGEAQKPRVGLFVTCLVDLFRPSVGFAAVKLLEDAGCDGRGAARRPAAASRPTIPATAHDRARLAAAGDRAPSRATTTSSRRPAPAPACSRRIIPSCSPTTPTGAPRAAALRGQDARAGQRSWSMCCGVEQRRRALRRRASPITIPARACASSASRRSRAGCSRAVEGLKLVEMRDARCLLRLRRHLLRSNIREISNAIVDARRPSTSRRPAPTRCSPAISAA